MVRLVNVYGKNDKNIEVLIFSMVCHLPLAEHTDDLNALVNDMTRYSDYYTDIRVEMFREG